MFVVSKLTGFTRFRHQVEAPYYWQCQSSHRGPYGIHTNGNVSRSHCQGLSCGHFAKASGQTGSQYGSKTSSSARSGSLGITSRVSKPNVVIVACQITLSNGKGRISRR